MGVNIKSVHAARQEAGRVIVRLPGYRTWAAENVEHLRDRLQG